MENQHENHGKLPQNPMVFIIEWQYTHMLHTRHIYLQNWVNLERANVGTHMAQHRGSHMISQTSKTGHVDQWIGLREKLEENAIFHGKIFGFL